MIAGLYGSECHGVVINTCQCQPMHPSLMYEEQSHVCIKASVMCLLLHDCNECLPHVSRPKISTTDSPSFSHHPLSFISNPILCYLFSIFSFLFSFPFFSYSTDAVLSMSCSLSTFCLFFLHLHPQFYCLLFIHHSSFFSIYLLSSSLSRFSSVNVVLHSNLSLIDFAPPLPILFSLIHQIIISFLNFFFYSFSPLRFSDVNPLFLSSNIPNDCAPSSPISLSVICSLFLSLCFPLFVNTFQMEFLQSSVQL